MAGARDGADNPDRRHSHLEVVSGAPARLHVVVFGRQYLDYQHRALDQDVGLGFEGSQEYVRDPNACRRNLGAYVETEDGRGWFLHFQLRGAHGRIVHLEPVRWEQDWPIIGQAPTGATAGEPVSSGTVQEPAGRGSQQHPQTSDEFSRKELGPQWEWNHNPDDAHWTLAERPGFLRLKPMQAQDLTTARNTLTQPMQDQSLEFTAHLDVRGMKDGVHSGLAMFERSASGLMIVEENGRRRLSFFQKDGVQEGPLLIGGSIELRVRVEGDSATYSYSLDEGHTFQHLGSTVAIKFSWWKGSRPSLFAYTTSDAGQSGYVDFDWVRYRPINKELP